MKLIMMKAMIAAMLAMMATVSQGATATAHVCVDENPWPPYTYWDPKNKDVFKGYTVELATEVFKSIGLSFDINRLPWTEVHERAQSKDRSQACDVILDVSLTSERQKYLYFSRPIYQLHYAFLFSKKRFPQGLQVKSLPDLNAYKVCGVESYNYGYLANQLTIIRRDSIQKVFDSLETPDCDVFPVESSVVKFGQKMGLYKFPALSCMHLSGITKSYRVAVAKNYPDGQKWIEKIEYQLDGFQRKGKLNEWVVMHDIGPMSCAQTLNLK